MFHCFPAPAHCHSVRIKELDGHRIVDGKFDNNVLMLVGERNGVYSKFILRFDTSYATYDIRIVNDIAYEGLNFVTLDNGICLHLNENEELEIFSSRIHANGLNILADATLQGARLFKHGTQALFSRDDTLYSMTMQ